MAAAFLRASMEHRPGAVEVTSAGFGPPGLPAVDEAVAVMHEVGIDLRQHRSQLISLDLVRASDLIVVMTRQHAIDVVLLDLAAWPRTFPIVDLVGRGRQIGPIGPDETLRQWVVRAHGGRQRDRLLALPVEDDITDPLGGPLTGFRRTRDTLKELTAALAALIMTGTEVIGSG